MKRAEQNLNNFLIFFNLTFQEGFAILLQPRLGANLRPKNHVRGVRFFFSLFLCLGQGKKLFKRRGAERERERETQIVGRVTTSSACDTALSPALPLPSFSSFFAFSHLELDRASTVVFLSFDCARLQCRISVKLRAYK